MAGTLQLEETNEAEMTEDMTGNHSTDRHPASFVRKYLDHIRMMMGQMSLSMGRFSD